MSRVNTLAISPSANLKSFLLRLFHPGNSQFINWLKFKIPLWNYNSITIIQQHLIFM